MAVLMAYMALSPAVRQVADVRTDAFRYWRMYSGVGFDICRATYLARRGDGTMQVLDTRALLGEAPGTRLWKVANQDAARSYARRLCRASPGLDVRADVECPDRRNGWKVAIAKDEPLCAK